MDSGHLGDIRSATGLPPSARSLRRFHRGDGDRTGKTYVYLRTIFELNALRIHKLWWWSRPWHQGRRLQDAPNHRRALPSLSRNTPFEFFFTTPASFGQVRNFATKPEYSDHGGHGRAINKKDVNNLYKDTEKTGGEKPIDLTGRRGQSSSSTNPERGWRPGRAGQGSPRSHESALHPALFRTHADKHHMLYRLDAVDAYERKL